MTKALKWFAIAALALGTSLGATARADIANATATNVQEGDNDSSTDQSGSANSGDAVGGQVTGVVSSGDVSVDATNHSEDVDINTGDADGTNDAAQFTGLNAASDSNVATGAGSTILNGNAVNVQIGDNSQELSQDATATSGDGVGGSVIGVVTSAGGSADVVAANTSTGIDIDTGDADASNDAASFVGLNNSGTETVTAAGSDIANASATNVQIGDNDLGADQSATATSGDGVGGQVLGIVSAGDASVDATNHSEDVDLTTGDGDASNEFAAFVGLNAASDTDVTTLGTDILNGTATNVQDGDNSKDVSQDATAGSGDAVGGQVAGVVTSAGGSADLVLANTSTGIDGDSGDSDFDNFDEEFVGLNASDTIDV
jgi:hypothetical protein